MNSISPSSPSPALRFVVTSMLVLSLGTPLTACVYRPDLQQGNEITEEMISQVNPGMTRREVVKVLGTPLINDPFNRNRWDYFFSHKSGKTGSVKSNSVKLLFEGDYLVSLESDIAPDGSNDQDTE